jgi:hypothetical protein
VADIGANEFGFRAKRAKFGDQRLAGVIVTAGDDNSGAFTGEGESRGTANAGQGAGDQDNGITHVISPSKKGEAYLPGLICNLPTERMHGVGYGDALSLLEM